MRYERKYKVEDLSLALIFQLIKNHPASFKKIYPDRQVNNIYFDTPQLTTYHDNVKGIAQRKKYRVRWYGDDPHTIEKPILELKIKDNQLGRKESTPLKDFEWNELPVLTRQVIAETGGEIPLRPSLANAYRRAYFGSPDGKFRITVDWDMRFFSLLTASKLSRYNIKDRGVVLELKYDEAHQDKADRILQFIRLRQTKSSKYVNGMNLTGM